MAEQTTTQAAFLAEGMSPLNASSLFDVVAGLAFIIFLIFILAVLFRKFGSGSVGMGSLIKVIAAMSLGGRDRIALVSVGKKQMLLGISPGRIATLHVFDEAIDIQQNNSGRDSGVQNEFAAKLQSLLVGQK